MSHLFLLRATRPMAGRVLLASSPFAFFSSKLDSSPPSVQAPASKPTVTTSRHTASASERALFQQVSYGSILGVVGGLLFSKVSRILVVLVGFGGVVLHTFGLKGVQLLPVGWLGRRFKGVDWVGWVVKNPGFKISFSIALMTTAFLREY